MSAQPPLDRKGLTDAAESARRRFVEAIRNLQKAGVSFIDRAAPIDQALLEECRVFADRKQLLRTLPCGGVMAELGVDKGEFSRFILDTLKPHQLHLFDIAPDRIDRGNIGQALDSGLATFHIGDSSSNLRKFASSHFDLVYVDGDHSYEGVMKDIVAAESRLKPGGHMVLNDYTAWSPASMSRCGVARAANEFVNQRRWPVVALALQGAGYYDLCIRKPSQE
jgi:hypothetical protein